VITAQVTRERRHAATDRAGSRRRSPCRCRPG
jgi:hypothetical protein